MMAIHTLLSQSSKKYIRMADNQPKKNKKNFRPTEKGAGMTRAGVKKYRAMNPGSKLKTAVTGKVKKGSKAAKRRKSYCARSAGQMKKFPKAAANPNSRLRQARNVGNVKSFINNFYIIIFTKNLRCRYEHGEFYGCDG